MTQLIATPETGRAAAPFYVTGGTVSKHATCYVERDADEQLYDALRRGEFCDVLTSRQMGKSSLMVRVADRLRAGGAAVAVLDLTVIGQNVTAEQWYLGMLTRLGEQVGLEDELDGYWDAHAALPTLQRWMGAVRAVVMARVAGPLVIFIDEIDFVRVLGFPTDEFFAGIRECYNRRADEPDYARLAFCLIGVATPSDLIRDTRTTPFNIGRRIELQDFTAGQAAALAAGLGREPRLARSLVARVLYWTAGQPFLTQRLCKAIAEDPAVVSPAGVDRTCAALFLGHRAGESDDNLRFVRDRMLRNDADRAALLELYRRVLDGRDVPDDETNPLVTILRLSGIARARGGRLEPRNRIYSRVFNAAWITANMPDAEVRRQRAAYRRGLVRASAWAAVIIAVMGVGLYTFQYLYERTHVAYFTGFTLKDGLPAGAGELDGDEVRRRHASLKVSRRGAIGRVVSIEAVNGRGAPVTSRRFGRHLRPLQGITPWARECQWKFGVYDDKRVVYEQALNRAGQTIWTLLYSPPEARAGSADGTAGGAATRPTTNAVAGAGVHVAQARFVASNEYAVIRPSAQFIEFEYDDDGREVAVRFRDSMQRPDTGSQRATDILQTFDTAGRVTAIEYRLAAPSTGDEPGETLAVRLEWNGERLASVTRTSPDKGGTCAGVVMSYDAAGNCDGVRFVDERGSPAVNDGMLRHVLGGLLEAPGFAFPPGLGDPPPPQFHRWVAKYNASGEMTEAALLDRDGKPALDANGFNRWTAAHDDTGHVTSRVYFDDVRQLTAKVRYGTIGEERERAWFGPDGQPARPDPREGWRTAREYHPNGQPRAEVTTGFDLAAVRFARRERTFDTSGHERTTRFLAGDEPGAAEVRVPTLCRVIGVTPGSRSESTYGVRRGDVLVRYAGAYVSSAGELYSSFDQQVRQRTRTLDLSIVGTEKGRVIDRVIARESGMILETQVDPDAPLPDGAGAAVSAPTSSPAPSPVGG
jgi:hypothetical protein